jgi:PAS domain S-box-containing protein
MSRQHETGYGHRLRVLIVEDLAEDAELIDRELRHGGLDVQAETVEDRATLLGALVRFAPDIVLSDYKLPGFSGTEAIALTHETSPDTPVILVTGSLDEETAVRCMRAGAADYVLKDRLTRLPAAIRGALERRDLERARRAAEDALRESEQRFRRLFEQAPLAYQSLDAEGRVIEVNQAWLSTLGYGRDEVEGRQLAEFLVPVQRGLFERQLRSFMATGEMHGAEYDMVRANGSTFVASFDGRVVRDSSGQFVRGHCILSDITARRRAEITMRLQAAALESAANGIVITDAEGTILWANPAFTRLSGYPLSEVLGRNPRFQKSGAQDVAFYSALWKQILAGRPWHGELLNRRRDGVEYTEEMTITPLRDAAGGVTNFIAIKQDVTTRKSTESRLQTALREKDVLLREVHHRVKNNLQAMIYLVDSHLERIQDPHDAQFLKELQEQTRTMALVYEQLYQSESLAQVDMAPYLETLLAALLQAFGAGREIQAVVECEAVTMEVDVATPVGLIVNELVTNALKHAFQIEKHNGPRILVRLVDTGAMFTLTVSDNGVGFPASFALRSATTMGVKLVHMWVTHQLGGTLVIAGNPGVEVEIRIPKRARKEAKGE